MISVPIVSVSFSYRCDAEVEDRAHREHAEELDRREEDREDLLDVRRLSSRFASFSASNSAWNRRSRLNACTIAIPATDSAICAVTAPIRLRGSTFADVRDALEPAREDERRRQDDECDEPEPPVGDEERRHSGGQEDDVRDQGGHAL